MARSGAQLEVEQWIRTKWLPGFLGRDFQAKAERIPLKSGGFFKFDAVSADGQIVANISTSRYRTTKGKIGSGKMHKVRSDIYFLCLASAEEKLMLLTETDMHDAWCKEAHSGRVPDAIEILLVKDIPDDLRENLERARLKASREVTPQLSG